MAWFHDPYWIATLEVAKKLSNRHKCIVVPEEFVKERNEFFPMHQAKQLSSHEISAFIIQKDQVNVLPISLLQEDRFSQFHCIFANEVFVVYSELPEGIQCTGDTEKHLTVFLENRAKLLEKMQYTGEQQDSLPYLLDTQRNRILQQMFPHKSYVTELFEGLEHEPRLLQKEVVKYCIKEVRIELSGFCNRSCQYCPVSFLDKKDKNKKLPKEVLQRCIEDLKEIQYDGQVWFCLFNEPLYDKEYLFDVLDYVAQQLPKSFIKIVSNGDYLNADYFRELLQHKVDELTISVHYDGKWSLEKQKQKMYEIMSRIKIEENGEWEEGTDRLIFEVSPSVYQSKYLSYFSLRSEDFDAHGMDRGGVLNHGILQLDNLDHCDAVMHELNISYDGTVVPCCNMCSDTLEIKPWTYGTVTKDRGIFEIYTSNKAADFRKILFAPRENVKETPVPCRTCSVAECDGNEKVYRSDDWLRSEIRNAWLENR